MESQRDVLRHALISFRQSTTHSSAITRQLIQTLILEGHGRDAVDLVAYRVCSDTDVVFMEQEYTKGEFISCCASLKAAKRMLQRPPNPRADKIV